MSMSLKAAAALLLCGAACAGAGTQDGFTPLFNGKDLTGWGYKNGEKFDGKTESSDARYTAKDGMIVVSTLPMVPRAAITELRRATRPGIIPKIRMPMIFMAAPANPSTSARERD